MTVMKRWILLLVVLALLASVLVACRKEADDVVTFEEYNAMTEQQQYEFYSSFSDPQEFFAWYNDAKAAYLANHPTINGNDATIFVGEGQE